MQIDEVPLGAESCKPLHRGSECGYDEVGREGCVSKLRQLILLPDVWARFSSQGLFPTRELLYLDEAMIRSV